MSFAWPDLSDWWWKDEVELQERVDRGLLDAARAGSLRAELVSVIADLDARRGVFASAERWRSWRPPASWAIPTLPDGWDVLSG